METWQQLSVPPLSAAGRKVLTIMHRMQAQEEQSGPTQLKKPKITRPRDPFLSGPAEFFPIVPTVFTPHETVENINIDHISDESFHWTPNNPIPIIADELEEPLTMNPIYKIPAQLKPYKAKALPHFGSPCCSFRGPTNFVVTTKTEFPFSKSMDHRTATPTKLTTSKLINLANARPQSSVEKRSCQIIKDVRGGQPSKPLINSRPQGRVEEKPRQIIKDLRGGQPSKPLINSTNSIPQGRVEERPRQIIKDARVGQPPRPLSDVICDLEYQSVFTLLPSERLVLLSMIEKAEFVGLTLVEREPGCNTFNQGNSLKFSGVMLLIQMKFTSTATAPQPGFYFLPFPNSSKEDKTNGVDLEFAKLVLLKTLRHNGCVSCFRAQELMRTILLCPQLSFTWRDAQGWEVMDPEVASWLLDPNLHAATPETLLNIHLQQVLPDLKKLSQAKRSCTVLSFLPQLSNVLLDKLKKENQWIVFREMEMKLTPVLAAMETYQFNLDTECLNNSSQALSLNLHNLEHEAHQAAGEPFLLTSNAQLREILFNKLKLKERCPNKKLQKTGITKQQSTSEAVLLQLQNLHPLPGIILQYRQTQKMKSTYVDGILAYVENGSLSTNWEQMGAVSGRLSSRQPNIQSIPKQPLVLRGESHGEVVTIQARAPFLPKPGSSLLCADFSHVELRLLAHLSEDPALLRLFEDSSAGDIFVSLASKWLGKQELEVTPAERERGKRIVYSIIYGVGSERLSRVLGVSPKEACDVMTAFGKRFQGLAAFTQRIQHCCRNTGYAISLLGRKRWLPQINSPSFQLRAQAERQAVNFTVQGSAADICKLAMVRVFSALQVTPSLNARSSTMTLRSCYKNYCWERDGKPPSIVLILKLLHQNQRSVTELIAQIHDELLFEVEDSQIQNLKEVVTSTMTSLQHLEMWNVSLKVPLPIHSSWGKSWAHLEGEEEAPFHVQQRSSTDLINEGR